MELSGRIIVVLEAKSGTSSKTGNPWMMQEYVIEVPGQYPRHCAFTVFGEDRIKQLNIQNGEDLTVQFDIDAREWNGRWFTDIRAFDVRQVDPNAAPAPQAAPILNNIAPAVEANPAAPFPPQQESAGESADDLPF